MDFSEPVPTTLADPFIETLTPHFPPATPSKSTPPGARDTMPSAARLLVSAALWGFLLPLAIVVGFGILQAILSEKPVVDGPVAVPPGLAESLPLAIGTLLAVHLSWVMLSIRKARATGRGNWRDGIGNLPIRRPGLVLVLAAILLAVATLQVMAVLWLPSLHALVPKASQEFGEQVANVGMAPKILLGLMMTVSGPIAEELFFRGWLWSGLRRHWGPVATAAATSAMWLTVHLPDGLTRPLFLLPAAVILSLVRHRSGSVRASILVHIANNAFAVVLLAVLAPH